MSKSNSQATTRGVIAAILLAALVISTLWYVVWRATSTANQQTNTTSQNTTTDAIPEKTIKLPNGKTATYPDVKTYRDIVFAVHNGDESSDYIEISHKAYQEYLTYLGGNVDDICGPDDAPKAIKKDIIYGLLNTNTKAITYPQNWSCIDLLASDQNPRPEFKQGAQDVLGRVKGDIESFLKSVTIQ